MLRDITILENLLKSKGVNDKEIRSVINSISLDLFDLNNFINNKDNSNEEKIQKVNEVLLPKA